MKWDDLIFIDQDELLDYVQLIPYTILKGHLTVGGLLNGCDLVQVKSFRMNLSKADAI